MRTMTRPNPRDDENAESAGEKNASVKTKGWTKKTWN